MSHTPLHDAELAEESGSSTLSLRQFLTVLRNYKAAILLSLVAVAVGYATIAVAYVVLVPSRRITTLPFRLEFKGAEVGQYPNGMKFSPSEIVSTPILLGVYNANALNDIVDFQTFKNSIFVVEANPALEALEREYRPKLSEPKLSAVDRDRLEQEFQEKRASISRSDYAITYVDSGRAKRLPKTVNLKVLADILATWAEQTTHKGVVLYDITSITSATFDKQSVDRYDYLIALDMLRVKINRVIANIDSLTKIPGAKVLRTAESRASLDELRFRLFDEIKFKIEPLVGTIINSGLTGGSARARDFVETRLAFNAIERRQAEGRVEMLRQSLQVYDEDGNTASPAAGSTGQQPQPPVVSQIDNSFLEQLVTLSKSSQDFVFRQSLVNDLRQDALKIVPLEAEEQYYRSLLDSLDRRGGQAPARPEDTAEIRQQILGAFDEAIATTNQVDEIYRAVSQNLNPSTVLYSTTAPPVTRHESSAASGSQLVLIAALLLLLTLPVSMVASFLHYRFTTDVAEQAMEEEEAAATAQPEPRVAGRA